MRALIQPNRPGGHRVALYEDCLPRPHNLMSSGTAPEPTSPMPKVYSHSIPSGSLNFFLWWYDPRLFCELDQLERVFVIRGYGFLTWRLAAVLTLPALLGLPACARAHVIPNDAKIELFLKPRGSDSGAGAGSPSDDGGSRVPDARATQDFVDLERADRVLNDAAGLWLVHNLEAYENNRPLPTPRVVGFRASLAFDGSFASYEQALAHVQGLD